MTAERKKEIMRLFCKKAREIAEHLEEQNDCVIRVIQTVDVVGNEEQTN